MEMRLTRSRARSLERQAEKQQQLQRKQRATSTDKRAAAKKDEERREAETEQQSAGKRENVLQTDKAKQSESSSMPPPVPKSPVVDKTAAGVLRVSPTAAAKAKPIPVESLSEESAQARKEEGLTEFTGEHPITPAPLQPTTLLTTTAPAHSATSTTSTPSVSTAAGAAQLIQPMHNTETSQSQVEKRKSSSRSSRVAVRAIRPEATERIEEQRGEQEEERKEAPSSYSEELKDVPQADEDNRSLFSTALPSPLSPIESKESLLEWDKHDSALSFDAASFNPPSQPYPSDEEDGALAWRLQQEEIEAAAASRTIHTFLAEWSYQPGWLRLSLAVCLVINVLLPLCFAHHLTAMVTLVCQVLQFGFAYWLYRVYDFTPHVFYSCALMLPSLLCLMDMHVMNTSWSDVELLGSALRRRPLLLLDGVVQLYVWQWVSVAVQAVELIGGMWLALKVR